MQLNQSNDIIKLVSATKQKLFLQSVVFFDIYRAIIAVNILKCSE